MHLNVRRPPFYARLPIPAFVLALFGRPPSPAPSFSPTSPLRPPSPPTSPRPSPADPSDPVTRTLPTPPPHRHGVPLAPIPPTSNPRGELIFSSRVPASFTAAYVRHRAAFERRRTHYERELRGKTVLGRVQNLVTGLWEKDEVAAAHSPSSTPASVRSRTPVPGARLSTPSPSRPPGTGEAPSAGEVAAAMMTRTISGGRRSPSGAGRPTLGRRESGTRLRDREGVET
jgi:hypothetical protein